MLVLLSSLILGACSSSDNDDSKNAAYSEEKVSEAPEWQIDWSNSQDCPDWSEPDGTLYENWTILMVQIEETLQPFVSENDMMAIFVNGELARGVLMTLVFGAGHCTPIVLAGVGVSIAETKGYQKFGWAVRRWASLLIVLFGFYFIFLGL